jgi:hypothetical protein
MNEIFIKRVSERREIEGIKLLQEANRITNITKEESELEGFVTADYSLAFLKMMNAMEPSVIACKGNEVVGYAMVTTKELYGEHPLLDGLFDAINQMNYKGAALADAKVVIVGQLCVAKPFRGLGLVQQMYHFFRNSLMEKYEYCITDISEANPRSLKAHRKCGFNILDTLSYEGVKWHIVLWDWTE